MQWSSAFFLLSLLLCFHQALSSKCSSVDVGAIDASTRRHRCVAAAAARHRSVAVISGDGACRVCGQFSPHHLPSSSRCQAKRCTSYKLAPQKRLLLLRTHSKSGADPYALLKTGTSNASLQTAPASVGDLQVYRSPLLDDAHEMGVSRVEVEMLSAKGDVAVRLGFSLTGRVQDGGWFSKASLVTAFPWAVDTMKGVQIYNVTSVR